MAMSDIPAVIQEDDRLDAGYQRRLLIETHAAAMDTRKRLFEGNGEPAILVQMATIKACQEQQSKDLDKLQIKMIANTNGLLAAQGTLKIIAGAWKYLGSSLLVALVIFMGSVIWSMVTHQAAWFQP
jgi:hypothetical protein